VSLEEMMIPIISLSPKNSWYNTSLWLQQ
jgi:hypothetical protein